jgi:hypothetical protein
MRSGLWRIPSLVVGGAPKAAEQRKDTRTNSLRLLHLLQLFHIHDCGSKTFVGTAEVELEVKKPVRASAPNISSRTIKKAVAEQEEHSEGTRR